MNNTPRILRIYLVNGTPDSSIATNVNTVIKPKLEKLPAINIKTILTNVNRTFTLGSSLWIIDLPENTGLM